MSNTDDRDVRSELIHQNYSAVRGSMGASFLSGFNRKTIPGLMVILLMYGLFVAILWPFKKALIFAILFAFALHPLAVRLSQKKIKKIKIGYYSSITLLLVSFIGAIVVPFVLLCFRMVNALHGLDSDNIASHPLVHKAVEMAERVYSFFKTTAAEYGFNISAQFDLKATAAQYAKSIFPIVTGVVTQVPTFLFHFMLFLVLIYYFLSQRHSISKRIIESKLYEKNQLSKVIEIFQNICSTVLVSTIVISAIQSLILSLAALFVGYNNFLLIFMCGFFFAFIPVLGTLPVSITLIVYSFFDANYTAVVVLLVAAGITGVIDNLIRSWIFSSQKDSVHPIISFLTIIGALSLFGLLGLFLGPLIAELTMKVSDIFLKQSYFSPQAENTISE